MTAQPTPKGAWKVTFLLFLFMLVNFADKIGVGLAGVPIMTELKLQPEQFGLLGSSFFFLFSISAIVVGFIVNRIPTRWVLLALAVPALNWIIVHHTWHYAFAALGIVGLMWVAAWFVWGKEGPLVQTVAMAAAEPRIPYFQLLTSRTFIGCVAATFGAYWALSLGLTWFTSFIVTGLGFSQEQAGWISILPWVFGALIVITTGWVSQLLMARGFATRGARGVLGSVPLIVGGLILATLPYVD